ncbi:MAG: hypothetical protein ACKO96_24105 [Flammeovirgaceae bacterium]
MGCLKLTYDYRPTELFVEQGEKVEAPELQVWVNPEGAFFGVDDKVLNSAGGDPHWWFDDPQGEFFFNHWRNGNGQALTLNNAEWSAYMRSNDYLANVSIASHLYSLGIKNSGWISGSFHGETGKSDWSSGYGMLGGSNVRVGDLQYSGYAHVNDNGSISYLLNFTWNDIMDPNPSHFGDRVGAALFPGTPYNVHISWTDIINITPK